MVSTVSWGNVKVVVCTSVDVVIRTSLTVVIISTGGLVSTTVVVSVDGVGIDKDVIVIVTGYFSVLFKRSVTKTLCQGQALRS